MALAFLCWAVRYPIYADAKYYWLSDVVWRWDRTGFPSEAIEITASGEPIKVSQQLAAVQKQYPQGSVTQFVPSKAPDLANRFQFLLEDGTSVFATVNQYTGEVVGEVPHGDSLYQLANDIHGVIDWWLGDYLIEVAISLWTTIARRWNLPMVATRQREPRQAS